MSKICVIGAGHVGLVTACCFAELGHEVITIDKDSRRVELLRSSQAPFFEPGLKDLLEKNGGSQRLRYSTRVHDGVSWGEIIFICVGTPSLPDGRTDLSQVDEVIKEIADCLNRHCLIVEKSTVPVGTSIRIRGLLSQFARPGSDFEVACNPEFLREGSAVEDFMHPDRVLIGAESERSRRLLLGLYQDFECPILVTDINTAEIIKHASNAFLTMKISFINMIANLCERVGADVGQVADGVGLDKRIGRAFLNAGLGYGGGCFPKDLRAFVRMAEELGVDFSLLKAVERLNEQRGDELIRKARFALDTFKERTIALLGLAFKPETDDIREAPSLRVIERLRLEGAHLRLHDPRAEESMKALYPETGEELAYCPSAYDAAAGADALLILTEAAEFGRLEWPRIKASMRTPFIIDGRNLLDPAQMSRLGFRYYSMGRSSAGFREGSENLSR